MNMVQILTILSILIDPLIWIKAAGMKFEKGSKNLLYCLIFTILSISLSCLSTLFETSGLFFSVASMLCVGGLLCRAYNGKLIKKITYTGVLILLSLASDVIVFVSFSIFGFDMQQLQQEGICNATAMVVSKFVMIGLAYLLNKKIAIGKETLPVVGFLIIMELPSVVLFNSKSRVFLLTYVISQAGAALFLIYIRKMIMNRKVELEESRNREEMLKREREKLRKEKERYKAEASEKAAEVEELRRTRSLKRKKLLEVCENRKKLLIDPDAIIYIEKIGRKVLIMTNAGGHEINGTIVSMEKELGSNFMKANQGTLVNKMYIEKIEGEVLVMKSGTTFRISRERARELHVNLERGREDD